MDSFLLDNGFYRYHSNNTVYTKKLGKSIIILVLYVDDIILTRSDPNHINHVNSSLKKKFEMTNFDPDLWRNAIKHKNKHKHKDAVEIIFHLINVK